MLHAIKLLNDAGHFQLLALSDHSFAIRNGGTPCGKDWQPLPIEDWPLDNIVRCANRPSADRIFAEREADLLSTFARWGTN